MVNLNVVVSASKRLPAGAPPPRESDDDPLTDLSPNLRNHLSSSALKRLLHESLHTSLLPPLIQLIASYAIVPGWWLRPLARVLRSNINTPKAIFRPGAQTYCVGYQAEAPVFAIDFNFPLPVQVCFSSCLAVQPQNRIDRGQTRNGNPTIIKWTGGETKLVIRCGQVPLSARLLIS